MGGAGLGPSAGLDDLRRGRRPGVSHRRRGRVVERADQIRAVDETPVDVVAALRESGELIGEPQKTQRKANFFEKGDKPLEIVTSRQWYIRNGGRDEDLRTALLARGAELGFHPDFMRVRYENWVRGLNNDWLVSRQRFFGVPFPLWYKVGSDGEVDYDAVLAAMDGIDTVVHLAGAASPEASWGQVLDANIVGTRNVLEAARAAEVARVVFASSNHAMGMFDRLEQWPV